MLVATVVSGILWLLGGLHVYWAVGGKAAAVTVLPKRDGVPLFQPTALTTSTVAVLLFSASLTILGRAGLWGRAVPEGIFQLGAWVLVAVFAGRAIGDFRWVGIFKNSSESDFSYWDTRLFVPLCLVLAAGCAVVALSPGRGAS